MLTRAMSQAHGSCAVSASTAIAFPVRTAIIVCPLPHGLHLTALSLSAFSLESMAHRG